jgi:hypothetical protein
MKNNIDIEFEDRLQNALKQIQLRAQVKYARSLTHNDLAELAGVNKRSIGDWMRGVCAPSGMSAVFELLSHLDEQDVVAVLNEWRKGSFPNKSGRTELNLKLEKSKRAPKRAVVVTTKKKTSK